MKTFNFYICFFLIPRLLLSLSTTNIITFLQSYLTHENHKLESRKFQSNLKNFDNLSLDQQESFISSMKNNDDKGVGEFILRNREFYTKKPKLKEIIEFFPRVFFKDHNNNTENNEKNNDFSLSKEFEQFLEIIENTYTEQHFEEFDKKTTYSNESMNDKMALFELLLNRNEDEDLKARAQKTQYLNKTHKNYKTGPKVDFISEDHREKFKDLLDNFFTEKLQMNKESLQPHLNSKISLHKDHYYNQSQQHKSKQAYEPSEKFFEDIAETHIPTMSHDHFDSNFSELISHVHKLDSLLITHNMSHHDLKPHLDEDPIHFLVGIQHILLLDENASQYNHPSNFLSIKKIVNSNLSSEHKVLNISFLQIKQDFQSALETPTSPDSDDQCLSKDQSKAISSALDDLSQLETSNAEDAENQLKKEQMKDGKEKSQLSMQMKMLIQLIKMVVNAIVSIITGFFRIIVPPAILAFFTCPEASFFPENLINIINFDDKTDQFLQKIEAYPAFFESFATDVSSKSAYYKCAQGLFTSECSALWPAFSFLTFLITQPPFTVIPFLLFLPVIDWIQLLPGDNPMCFLCCIQVLFQCKGIKFSQIPQCGALYNLDTLLRAISDLALLVFLGFSMVPGLCTYNPFLINMWMIPPRYMSEEEKMLRKSPNLKKLLKNVNKNDGGENTDIQLDCKKDEKKQKVENNENQELNELFEPIPDKENIQPDYEKDEKKQEDENNENQETNEPIEPIPDKENSWNQRYINEDYNIDYWEKKVTPDTGVLDDFDRKVLGGVEKNDDDTSKIHETKRKNIAIPGKTDQSSASGEIGNMVWDYPVGE